MNEETVKAYLTEEHEIELEGVPSIFRDSIIPAKLRRVFSHEQQAQIDRWESACAKAECDDNGHKCQD